MIKLWSYKWKATLSKLNVTFEQRVTYSIENDRAESQGSWVTIRAYSIKPAGFPYLFYIFISFFFHPHRAEIYFFKKLALFFYLNLTQLSKYRYRLNLSLLLNHFLFLPFGLPFVFFMLKHWIWRQHVFTNLFTQQEEWDAEVLLKHLWWRNMAQFSPWVGFAFQVLQTKSKIVLEQWRKIFPPHASIGCWATTSVAIFLLQQ